MPAIFLKNQAPTFNINGLNGWDTRTIYCYYGKPEYFYSTDNFTANLFGQIEKDTSYFKGTYTIKPTTNRYFKSGKNLRIRGRFLVSASNSPVNFNIYSKIYDKNTDVTTPISSTNNGNNHIFFNGDKETDVPCDFEILMTFIEVSDGGSVNFFCQSNGYYQYNIDNFNGNGNNIQNVYVPIWKSSGYVGPFSSDSEKSIHISFDNSEVTSIKVVQIIMEELS
jgi:hypothetical protein